MLEERLSLSTVHSKMDQRVFNQLLEKVGSNGKYQFIMVFIMLMANYLCGGLYCITPFLFYNDNYQCPSDTPLADSSCRQYVCSLPPPQRLKFVPDPSMHTLGNEFGDYRCDSEQLYLNLVQTMLYMGRIGGALLLTVVGDYFTRKTLFMANWYLAIFGLVMINFSSGLIEAGFWLFASALGIGNVFFMGFYFCSEEVGESKRQEYSILVQVFFGAAIALNPLWYYLLKDWRLVFWYFYALPTAVTIVLCWLYLVDTPICLVTRYPAEIAYNHFMFIAKLNGQQPEDMTVESIQKLQIKYKRLLQQNRKESQNKFTVKDLFKYPSLRGLTIMVIIFFCITMFMFFAPVLMIDKFKLNIFINGAVNGISQTLSYPLSYFLITRMGRRPLAYICFAVSCACSTILLFVWDQNEDSDTPSPLLSESIGLFTLIFLFRYAISVEYGVYMVYYNELYPTQVRVLGTSLATLSGGVVLTVTPEILTLCVQIGFPIMILFASFSLLGIYFSTQLPETFGVPPREIIEELAEKELQKVQSQELQMMSTQIKGSLETVVKQE